MTTITLADGVTAELAAPSGGRFGTRFADNDLVVSDQASAVPARSLVGSHGVDMPGADLALFAPDTGLLQDSLFAGTEQTVARPRDLGAWFDVEPMRAVLRLHSPRDFHLPSAQDRQYAPDGSVVSYVYEDAPHEPRRPGRVRIAPGVDLLLEDDRYLGWAVTRPERYLADLSTREPPAEPETCDPGLGRLLARYFDIVSAEEEVFDRLIDGDPSTKAALLDIRAELASGQGVPARRAVLLDKVDEILRGYFS